MVKEIFYAKVEAEIYGLVLAGGFSTRMGQDKAMISYRGQPMYEYAFHVISPLCEKVMISCREEQTHLFKEYPILPDGYPSRGPLTGLLSAFKAYPEVAWLVIPIDMPNLTTPFIADYLIKNRNTSFDATMVRDIRVAAIQPLVGIYEPSCCPIIQTQFARGSYSLKGMISNLQVNFIDFIDDDNFLANYNLPHDWTGS